MLGAVTGLLGWLSLSPKAAFALVGIGALGMLVFPGLGQGGVKAITISGCVLFAAANSISVKGTGRIQIVLVSGLLAIIQGWGRVGPIRPSGPALRRPRH